MSYAYELENGNVAIANNIKGVRGNPYIEVTEFPDAPRKSWRIVDGVLSFDATIVAQIAADKRRVEIESRLLEIDRESVRSLRVVTRGRGGQFDNDKLDTLEDEAELLRVELNGL